MRGVELFFKRSHAMSGHVCHRGIKLANEVKSG